MTLDPQAATGGIELTPAGQAYVLAHLRPNGCPPGIDPLVWRQAIERRVERHLGLVQTLLAVLDNVDGDENLEPSLGFVPLVGPYDLEADCDEDDDTEHEPSLGWTDMEARYGCRPTFDADLEHDDADDEPSLASPEPLYAVISGQMGFYPTYASGDLYGAFAPIGSQTGWDLGNRAELEDQHDGAEPDDEHGGGWSEASAGRGRLDGGRDEDSEASLSLTEHVNQSTRTATTGWVFEDSEADYERHWPFGPTNSAMIADDENSVSQSIITENGIVIHDPEDIEGGHQGMDNGVADTAAMIAEDAPIYSPECRVNGGGIAIALQMLREAGL